MVWKLTGPYFFVDRYAGKISNLLVQPGQFIKYRALATIGIPYECYIYLFFQLVSYRFVCKSSGNKQYCVYEKKKKQPAR